MSRSDDISQLKNSTFDVIVVGGGIYGSWIALHAAQAGLKVAIVEMNDWGSGTSSASSKLLHGGLRYLERFEFGMVRKSLLERRELSVRMPHHVRPLNFLLPIYRGSRFRRWQLKPGLWLYDFLAGRNQPVERHRSMSADTIRSVNSQLKQTDLLGGFRYGDCATDDSRMVLEIIDSAVAAGAVAVSGIAARQLERDGERVTGIVAEDDESSETFSIRGRLVVDTSGPWVLSQTDDDVSLPPIRHTKGVHLVMPSLGTDHSALLTAPQDGRVFFIIPWYGRTLLGTTDTNHSSGPQEAIVSSADVDYLLDAVNGYLIQPWTRDDVQGTFAGLRTMLDESGAAASSVSREWVMHESAPGLMTSIGGKYTSARIDAFHATEEIVQSLTERSISESQIPMAWFPESEFLQWQQAIIQKAMKAGFDGEVARTATHRFGRRLEIILELAMQDAGLTSRIVEELPFSFAEVVYSCRFERVRTLTDLLRRRIPLMLLTRLTEETVRTCCDLAAKELNWDQARQDAEVSRVMSEKAESMMAVQEAKVRQ